MFFFCGVQNYDKTFDIKNILHYFHINKYNKNHLYNLFIINIIYLTKHFLFFLNKDTKFILSIKLGNFFISLFEGVILTNSLLPVMRFILFIMEH